MEIAGLAVGVVGLAGLFNVCQAAIEQIDTYKNFGIESRYTTVQFELSKRIFQSWADNVGINGTTMRESHHPYLDNPSTASVVKQTLLSIGEIFDITVDTSPTQQLDLIDNNQSSSATAFGSSQKNSTRHYSSQASSKRDKIGWMLRGRNNFVKQVDAFGNLVTKLCALVPPRQIDSQLDGLDKSKYRVELSEYKDLLRNLKESAGLNKAATHDRICTWLGAVSTEQQYDKLCQTRLSGTCDWIFDNPAYMQWASLDLTLNKPKLFWINAPAGFGKSFLCARIIQSMKETITSPLAYFFCSSDVETQREPIAIIRSWILQLVKFNQEAFDIMQEKSCVKETHSASSFDIWELFRSIISVVPNTTLVLDGLDECTQTDTKWRTTEDNMRQDFLEELKKSVKEITTRILVVSREEVDIRSGISLDTGNAAAPIIYKCRLSIDDVQPDIALFSRSIVDRKLSNKPDALREEIATQMTEKSNGMFLWVKLQAKHLRKGENRKQLHETIKDMPAGLEHVYDRDWLKISNLKRHKSRALAILRWVTFALRPLTVIELTEALIVICQGDGCDDLRIDEWPDSIDQDYIDDQIIGLCGSMLEIKSTYPDQPLKFRTVHLVHFSVKEFLLRTLPETDGSTIDSVAFSDRISQNNHLADICLRYLSYKKSWHCSVSSGCDRECRPFLDYAVRSWHLHVFIESEMNKELSHSINRFFHPKNQNWHLWRMHFERNPQTTTEAEEKHDPATSLYYASLFGFTDAVEFLKELGNAELNVIGGHYGSALQAACVRGHLSVVKFLCNHGADINLRGGEHGAAINAAAFMGHEKVVQHLLDFEAEISITDAKERTPIYLASREGHLKVVQLLFEKEADFNIPNYGGWTPLNAAADWGHIEVVKFLFEKGADITIADFEGWTPLNAAAYNGHVEIVKFLFEKGADITIANSGGWTPLHAAAQNNHLEVVKLLLDKGANITTTSLNEWTPLNLAAHSGHFEVVKLLLENGANIAMADSNGWTPLHVAARKGHFVVVKLLLDNGADIAVADSKGWTPLNSAAHSGHFEVVKLLLDNGADIAVANSNGWTPLHVAARKGHLEVVKVLLAKVVDLSISGDVGWASFHAKVPLSNEAVDVTVSNKPVSNAEGIVALWLNMKSLMNQTPLHLAALKHRKEVVTYLLDHQADANLRDGYGLTSFDYVRQDIDLISLMKSMNISCCFTEPSIRRSYIIKSVVRILDQVQSQPQLLNLMAYNLSHCLLLLHDKEAACDFLQQWTGVCCNGCSSDCEPGNWHACIECTNTDLCNKCMELYPLESVLPGCIQHEFVEIVEKSALSLVEAPDKADGTLLQLLERLRLKYKSISNLS